MTRKPAVLMVLLFLSVFAGAGCPGPDGNPIREDGAVEIDVDATGSLQNAAWSPDSTELLCTLFKHGYNREPADLLVVDLDTTTSRVLVSDGSGNINLPGSSWNPGTDQIVFASTRDPHDELFVIDADANPGDEQRVTSREDLVAYEPSLSPDGQWVVFESHMLDVEDNGLIMKFRLDGTGEYIPLTEANADCRQPNWAPQGGLIVYQRLMEGQWDLWVMNTDGSVRRQVTAGLGDKTDASFSPNGEWLVYSSDEGGLNTANLFIVPIVGGPSTRVTYYEGYDGAPSWSPDGTRIAFESSPVDPDDSDGTRLWFIDAP